MTVADRDRQTQGLSYNHYGFTFKYGTPKVNLNFKINIYRKSNSITWEIIQLYNIDLSTDINSKNIIVIKLNIILNVITYS